MTFWCLITITNAQEFEIGKVSIAELQEKVHPIDSSASASILFEKGEAKFNYIQDKGFVLSKIFKIRIKIYKKSGYNYGNHTVLYSPDDKFYITSAKTYNLVNGKIEKTKLEKEGIFDEKVNKYQNKKKLAMPNVKEGSVIELEYFLETESTGNISEWEFQSKIPINFSEYKTYIPEYYTYKPHYKGYLFPEVTTFDTQRNITVKHSTDWSGMGRPKITYENITCKEIITTYISKNFPALKEEPFVNNVDNYASSVSHELSIVKYPNSAPKTYNTDWESVVKLIYKFDDFGGELSKSGYFEQDIKVLTSGLASDKEKVYAIFNFVKSKVKWNQLNGFWCNDGVKKAYKDKVGNSGEINLMLTAMLRYSGLKANPILVSTRSNGITYLPSFSAYNHVIAGVELEDGLVLLDATDLYSIPNILPEQDLNWFGQLIREDGSSESVSLNPKINSKDQVALTASISEDGTVKGQYKRQLTDYNAFSYRHNYASLTTDSHIEKIENANGGIEISDLVVENKTDLSKPIIESYAFTDDKHVEVINDKIYFAPLLFDALSENPFKSEKREYPIDYSFPNSDKYILNYTIPNGYEIESMPAPINMKLGENLGAFKYLLNKGENNIQVIVQFDINTPIISPDYYEDVKMFYQKMIEKQNEKIILKKVQ